jgi:hypothetical protein
VFGTTDVDTDDEYDAPFGCSHWVTVTVRVWDTVGACHAHIAITTVYVPPNLAFTPGTRVVTGYWMVPFGTSSTAGDTNGTSESGAVGGGRCAIRVWNNGMDVV